MTTKVRSSTVDTVAATQLTGTITPQQVANNLTYGINATSVTNGVYTNGSYSDPDWLTLSKVKVGLGNVDNTADANKSVNYATSAGYSSTQSVGDNSTRIATTAFVQSQVSSSAVGWNVTYSTTTVATGGNGSSKSGTYTLPTNCLGVYVYGVTYGGVNNGGIWNVQIKDGAGNVLGTVQAQSTNQGPGGDGGSGMTDSGATFIPMSSNARSIYVYQSAGSGSASFYVQAYVTK